MLRLIRFGQIKSALLNQKFCCSNDRQGALWYESMKHSTAGMSHPVAVVAPGSVGYIIYSMHSTIFFFLLPLPLPQELELCKRPAPSPVKQQEI